MGHRAGRSGAMAAYSSHAWKMPEAKEETAARTATRSR
jgi:hypothetical protein